VLLSVTNCFRFHLVVLKARNMNVLGLEKFRMNTIQTEEENFVCLHVERTLAGAVENEEHLGCLRERNEEKNTENLIRNFVIIYAFYPIHYFLGRLTDAWLLQEHMNFLEVEKLFKDGTVNTTELIWTGKYFSKCFYNKSDITLQ